MDTFVIDRAKWFNGRDIQYSDDVMKNSVYSSLTVPEFNKQCCFGIYLSHRGISKEIQNHYVSPATLANRVNTIQHDFNDDSIEALYYLLLVEEENIGDIADNNIVDNLMVINDSMYEDLNDKDNDDFRENQIKENFEKLGIGVSFVGEYVEGPYKE